MNWNDHLPALLLMIPLFGAFAAPWSVFWERRCAMCCWSVFLS